MREIYQKIVLELLSQIYIALGNSSSSLPSQTGNAGKFLTTDGTTASWATVSGSGLPTPVNYTAGSFGGNNFRNNISTTSTAILYIKHGNDQVTSYTANFNSGILTLELPFVPTTTITIQYAN